MLVGREAERARVEALLARAQAGESAVLVLRGEPGIGKSALLEHAAAQMPGALVLRARGVDSELELAWAGLHELLRPVLASVEQLPGPQADALRGALGLAGGAPAERHLVGAATLGVLAGIAERRPTVVLLDDAQWLDGPSASALLFAARRLLADAVTVLAAVRTDEPSAFDGAGFEELALGGLQPAAARELLEARAGRAIAADTAAWLQAATGGNPLALTELADEAPRLRPGPVDDHVPVGTRIARAFGRRLDAIGDEAGRAAIAAAVADDDSLATILDAAGRIGGSLAGLERAEGAGLLVLEPGRVAFRHPLVRSAVLARASAPDRRAAHRAYAAALREAGDDGDRVVWHEAAAALAPDEAIAAGLQEAGERAAGRGGHAAAASAFAQAARLTPDPVRRAARQQRAAEAAWLAGDGPRALALLGEVPADPEAEHLRGRVLARRGPVPAAIRVLRDAAAATEDPARAAEMLAEAALAAIYAGTGDLDELAREALELAHGPRARALALVARGAALVIRGDAAAADALEQAGALIRATPELRDDVTVAVWLGVPPAFLRAGLAQYRPLADAIALARDRGAVGVLPVALFFLGCGEFSEGRWARAAAGFAEAARLAEEAGLRVDETASLAGLARLEARRGDGRRAAVALERARDASLPFFQAWALHAQGEAALGAGDAPGSLEAFEAKARLLDEHGLVDPDLSPAPEMAEALVRLGRTEEAAGVARRALAGARAKEAPWALARAWRAVGLGEEALEPLETALALHARAGDRFETARTNLCLGERLRRAGRRGDARAPLREALADFGDLRAAPWSARAAAELEATGESVRRRDAATLDELTPQELRVATTLAGGATTREAGAALYLSPKTVEYHLRHVYLKLGINSRAALAAALATDAPRAPG